MTLSNKTLLKDLETCVKWVCEMDKQPQPCEEVRTNIYVVKLYEKLHEIKSKIKK